MSPFDFAWMLLKQQEVVDPYRHFLPDKQRFRNYKELEEHGWDGPVDDAPTPDLETPSATAPDRPSTPPSGMSAEEKLEALLAQHPELRQHLGPNKPLPESNEAPPEGLMGGQ